MTFVAIVGALAWVTFAWAFLRLLRRASAADARPRARLARRAAAGGVVVLLGAPAVASACPGADALPGGRSGPEVAEAVTCVVNAERRKHDLRPLRTEPHLARSAWRYARRMAAERFFSHVAPDGERFADRLRASGWMPSRGSWWAGENLAWGAREAGTPTAVVAAWLASPTHATVVLGRYREVGVGVADGLPRPSAVEAGATFVLHAGRRIRRLRAP